MKGVGRNPEDDGKKKGGLKVHMLIDAHADTPAFVKISEAKCHDKTFIQYLNLPEHSMVVFDRAYNHYLQFAKFTEKKINFVCRLKKNTVYDIIEQTYFKELVARRNTESQKKNTSILHTKKMEKERHFVYAK